MIVVERDEHALVAHCPEAVHPVPDWGLVSLVCRGAVHLLVELGVIDMDLIGSDAHNRAIFFVEFLKLEQKLALVREEVVIRLVVICDSSKLRPWDVRDAVEEESMNRDRHQVNGK